jgi:ACS family hexuronate transporter-like MFS transporter
MNGQAIGKYRWTVCALLFFATTVNYLDRQVLSLLAPDLSKEFGWTNSDYANITAAFQFVYAISMLFAGRVVDRLGTKSAFILAITAQHQPVSQLSDRSGTGATSPGA